MSELFAQGVELLVYGMGTVVVFLALLVLAMRIMSRVVLTWFPEPEPAAVPRRALAPATPSPAADPSPQLLAAISAAVHLHRQRRGVGKPTRQSGRPTGS